MCVCMLTRAVTMCGRNTTIVSLESKNLRRTDAFEVHYDGELLFSKLAMKRMPHYEEIVSAIGAMRAKNG